MDNLHRVMDIREGTEVPDVADKHTHSSYKQEIRHEDISGEEEIPGIGQAS